MVLKLVWRFRALVVRLVWGLVWYGPGVSVRGGRLHDPWLRRVDLGGDLVRAGLPESTAYQRFSGFLESYMF